MINTYRPRATGALLDEYEKAIDSLKKAISRISGPDLEKVIDPVTQDLNCKSFQTILTHVVASGYNYAVYIRNSRGENLQRKEKVLRATITEYLTDLNAMFQFNVETLQNIPDAEIEEPDNSKKFRTPWDQSYDIEQMMEHAIVHVLRHRRQIEKFRGG